MDSPYKGPVKTCPCHDIIMIQNVNRIGSKGSHLTWVVFVVTSVDISVFTHYVIVTPSVVCYNGILHRTAERKLCELRHIWGSGWYNAHWYWMIVLKRLNVSIELLAVTRKLSYHWLNKMKLTQISIPVPPWSKKQNNKHKERHYWLNERNGKTKNQTQIIWLQDDVSWRRHDMEMHPITGALWEEFTSHL